MHSFMTAFWLCVYEPFSAVSSCPETTTDCISWPHFNLPNSNLKNSANNFSSHNQNIAQSHFMTLSLYRNSTDWSYGISCYRLDVFVHSTTISLIIDYYPQNFTHTSLCSALSHLLPAIAIRMSGGPYLVSSLIQFFKAWNELWN